MCMNAWLWGQYTSIIKVIHIGNLKRFENSPKSLKPLMFFESEDTYVTHGIRGRPQAIGTAVI
jgi:hypothetical protein